MNSKQVNETVNRLVSFMGDVKDGNLREILANMQKMCDYQAEKLRIYEEHLTTLTGKDRPELNDSDLLGLVTHDEYGVLQPKKEQEGIPCDINNVGKKIFSKTEFVRLELKIKKNGIVQDLPSKVTAKVATKLLGKQIEAMDKAAHQGVVVIWGKKIKTIVTVEKICICTGENSYKWEFVSRSITTQTEKIPTSIFLSEELK